MIRSDKPSLLDDVSFGREGLFPTMCLATRYCVGQDIELGAAAHNPFDLPGSVHVAPRDDVET